MYQRVLAVCIGLVALAGMTAADEDRAGVFDYYVLSLSWSPNWCLREGDARGSEQCDAHHDFGWILHGLWPQYHKGFPEFCQSAKRPPSRVMTRDMADIMGTSGLAWHQWKKHGTCTGLEAADYFALSRDAYEQVNRPEVLRRIPREMRLPASVIEEAFLEANPEWDADMVTITCTDNMIQEARVCLSRDLSPVPCGQDVVRDCRARAARFLPIR
ncbi:MAG: ribonuclease T [Arenibacterium sp.]